jgi:hypothetical protein
MSDPGLGSLAFRFDTALPILIVLDTTVNHRADRTLHLAAEELCG